MLFFGDTIEENEELLFDENYKWLCQIEERHLFLPNMERMFLLSYLLSMSLPRCMDRDLVRAQLGVTIGRISNRIAFPVSHSREILELLLGSMKLEFLTGETPKQAATFTSRFMKVKGEFSQSDFQTPGWVYLTTTSW